MDIIERIGLAVVEPALVAVPRRHFNYPVFFTAQIPQHIQLRAAEVEPGKVPGHQCRARAGDIGRLDDHARPVRPAPAVVAAPPLAIHQLTNFAIGSDIVGYDATVFVTVVHPGLYVVEHPVFVFVVAGVDIGVGDHASGVEIERYVVFGHAAVDQRQHALEDFVVGPVGLDVRVGGVEPFHVFEGGQVVGEDRAVVLPVYLCGFETRSLAAVERRAQLFAFGVPVGGMGIFADIHCGEIECLLAVALGIGEG